ncbi:MAG TPA: VOC family protein [Nitrososphaeraceae archaeon]|jgi:catechol 2,3-dioxygenase-like lactoylglutathione lyase family enzyme|nr:VOC family protein [Nitrososphaeraceae archaeon]
MDPIHSPKTINHIAISVPDVERALKWYQKVMGFTVLRGPTELATDDKQIGNALQNIFGSKFKKLRIVWMSSANNVGFEIFQFIEPKQVAENRQIEYWSGGVIHIAVTERDIEGFVKKVTETGGRQLTKIWKLNPTKPYKLVFCSDPFGNIIEIYSHSFEQFHANM